MRRSDMSSPRITRLIHLARPDKNHWQHGGWTLQRLPHMSDSISLGVSRNHRSQTALRWWTCVLQRFWKVQSISLWIRTACLLCSLTLSTAVWLNYAAYGVRWGEVGCYAVEGHQVREERLYFLVIDHKIDSIIVSNCFGLASWQINTWVAALYSNMSNILHCDVNHNSTECFVLIGARLFTRVWSLENAVYWLKIILKVNANVASTLWFLSTWHYLYYNTEISALCRI